MKKLICILLVVLLLLSLSVTAFAAVNPVMDTAGILNEEENYQLIQMLAPYGNGVVCILTVDTLNGEDVEDYAESHAEDLDIGVLFVLAVQDRKWCVTASSAYTDVIDADARASMSEAFQPYLRTDDFYGAFTVFAEECGYYLDGYEPAVSGEEGDDSEGMGFFGRFLIYLLIGLVAGGITAGIMAGMNKSVRPQNSAANYVRSGSMQVNVSRDIFLYHNIIRTPKQQSSSSSGGGGGSRGTSSGSF